jgi:hypothetical protein
MVRFEQNRGDTCDEQLAIDDSARAALNINNGLHRFKADSAKAEKVFCSPKETLRP